MTHDAAKYDAEAARFLGALPEWCAACGMWRVHQPGGLCYMCSDDARVANTTALEAITRSPRWAGKPGRDVQA